MASTTTLLEAVNRVLLDVGERQVSTFTSPAASKAKAYLQDAFVDMQNFHDWEWTRTNFAATSWSTDEATFTNLRRIQHVMWQESNAGLREIPYVDILNYDYFTLESFNSTDNPSTKPLRWTQLDEDTIKINPYPTDATARAQLVVTGWQYLAPPENTTDTFSCPERFVPTIIKRAVYTMTLRHLGDLQAAQLLAGEFERQLFVFRTKESNVPSQGVNMWRFRGARL